MKVRITSSGDVSGTRVTTEEGVDLTGKVTGISWDHDAGDLPRARLNLMLVEVEVEGEAKMIAPNGKEVLRIEYTDGSVDEFV